MSVIKVTKDNFDEIKNGKETVLLDFYADWCGPCRMVAPIIEEIANEHPELNVGKINVDDERELAREFAVYTIPTLVIIKNGEVVSKTSGARPKDAILSLLN